MQEIFEHDFTVNDLYVDRYGRLKPSKILFLAQEAAGLHCSALALDYDTRARKRLFWAVTRHKVQITRLPCRGEQIRIETWPMPTTRVAFPRSMVAYDAEGRECFRSISIWVLMDLDTRNMILPGKSGISVIGTLRGTELPSPNGLIPKGLTCFRDRTVCFTDLDRNGHMNNTRYLDWIDDLLPSSFHQGHELREMTVCYSSEAREGQELHIRWDLQGDNRLEVEARRDEADKEQRVFSARLLYT